MSHTLMPYIQFSFRRQISFQFSFCRPHSHEHAIEGSFRKVTETSLIRVSNVVTSFHPFWGQSRYRSNLGQYCRNDSHSFIVNPCAVYGVTTHVFFMGSRLACSLKTVMYGWSQQCSCSLLVRLHSKRCCLLQFSFTLARHWYESYSWMNSECV